MRHIVLAAVAIALVGVLAGCGDDPPSTPDAARVLTDLDRPSSSEFAHGTFDFSRQIKGVASQDDGRLAGTSWDVYYVLDDGEVGSWGAGMDVFDSEESADASAEQLATFWVCDGPREPVAVDAGDTGVDVVGAFTCKRPTEDAYFATLSATDGVVTANLTLAASDRRVAADALVAVWASLRDTTVEAAEDLS